MATRKRNEWLDAGGSEDEDDVGYDSEAAEERKIAAISGRAPKRRRLSEDEDEDSPDEQEDDEGDVTTQVDDSFVTAPESLAREAAESDEAADAEPTSTAKRKSDITKPLTAKKLAASNKKTSKTGVIYISRIPPFMKPTALRALLAPYGPIGRIYLTPESHVSYLNRKRAGGNKKHSYIDGWVEFLSKRDAKDVAASLNAQTIGGKKGSYYRDDVWNLKYLKGFKWHHLTEQMSNENAERASRLRAEVARTNRENKEFLSNVETARMLERAEKQRKKAEEDGNAVMDGEEEQPAATIASSSRGEVDGKAKGRKEFDKMRFKQHEVHQSKKARAREKAEQPNDVKRVLSKIF